MNRNGSIGGIARAVLVIALATTSSACSYNRFVSQEEAIKAQWAPNHQSRTFKC